MNFFEKMICLNGVGIGEYRGKDMKGGKTCLVLKLTWL